MKKLMNTLKSYTSYNWYYCFRGNYINVVLRVF
jgi:hypothetical protein